MIGKIHLRAYVEAALTIVVVKGPLTLQTDPHFARHVHELASENKSDAAVVDFRRCDVLFDAPEAAETLAPVYESGEAMPRPIAMICLPQDFERFDDFALRVGRSRALRRAFTDLEAGMAWATQKGRVWRARQIEVRLQNQGALN